MNGNSPDLRLDHRRAYTAERLKPEPAVARFEDLEPALRWCGAGLKWEHFQPRPGWSMLVAEGGVAVVTGPLVAVVPEGVEMTCKR